MATLNVLKSALFKEFNGFSDKRINDIAKSSTFIIDDRSESDFGSNKRLYSYFCKGFANVKSEHVVKITLSGNVPKSPAVSDWMKQHPHNYSESIYNSLEFEVTPDNFGKISSLAEAILAIVKPGAKYKPANYKYVCPRISKSLMQLHKVLALVWGLEANKCLEGA